MKPKVKRCNLKGGKYDDGGQVMSKDSYEVGDKIRFRDKYRNQEHDGIIDEINERGTYVVGYGSGLTTGIRAVEKEEVIGAYPKVEAKKKRFSFFDNGGEMGGDESRSRQNRYTDYYLTVHIDGQGQYMASVYNPEDKVVFRIESLEYMNELIESGYLKAQADEDLDGLTQYLMEMEIIPNYSQVYSEDEFEYKIRENYEEDEDEYETNDECVEAVVDMARGVKEVADFFIVEGKLVIVFKTQLTTNEMDELNSELKGIKGCGEVFDDSFEMAFGEGYKSITLDLKTDDIEVGKFAKGGGVGKGYNVFNYTDNVYATDEVFKTKKSANEFIKEFRNRFSRQGYYRDNQMNKIAIEDIDLLAIPTDFSPFRKMKEGGSIAEGNYHMILSQAKEVKHHVDELQDILKKEDSIEAWVVAKMENVSSTLSDVTHYLDGKSDMPKAKDGMETSGNKRIKFDKLVGRVGDDYYFLDDIFEYKDGFKGATGTIVNPVNNSYYEYATSEDGILERYMDAMGAEEWMQTLNLDEEDFDNEDDKIKAIENGIYELHRMGYLNPFEEFDYKMEEQMRELPQFSDSNEYPLFEVIGGGRIFGADVKFDEIFDNELYKKVKQVEEFKLGGNVYSSHELFLLKVMNPKTKEVLETKRIFARNMKEAKKIAIEDFEEELKSKHGDYLEFQLEEAPQMMAKGGGVKKINYPSISLKEYDLDDDQTEIFAFIENYEPLNRQLDSIRKNQMTKIARGQFDETKAPKIFMYLIDNGIKDYKKLYGEISLTKKEKEEIANNMVIEFMSEAEQGNYENETFLPKKYLAEDGMFIMSYDVFDEDGDLVGSGLMAQDVVDYANMIWYYDMNDEDGEEMDDFDVAKDYLEQYDYEIKSNSPKSATNKKKVRRANVK